MYAEVFMFIRSGSFKKYILPIVLTVSISLLLLFAACIIIYNMEDPDAFARTASLASLFTGVFISGMIVSRINGFDVLSNLANGIAFTVLLMLISLIVGSSGTGAGGFIILHAAVPAVYLAGGFFGKRKSKKRTLRRSGKGRRR